jgi:2-hydroxy-3-oxopropionate reductase
MNDMTVGFVGLGIMGRPMVRRLLSHGFAVHVTSRTAADVEAMGSEGALAHASVASVVGASDATITMVPDTPDVVSAIHSEHGAIRELCQGKVLIDMSTISAVATRQLAEDVARTGARMLDAPVSGGEAGAINGTLSIMVGGDEDTYARCLPIFRALGSTVTHVGGNSAGQVVKSCNQILAASTIVAMSEALVLGAKAGVDPQKIVDVLSKGAARCWALEVRAPHVLRRDFRAGFKTALQYKDLGLAMQLADSTQSPLPMASLVHEFYKSCLADGRADEDHTAVIRVLERLAGVQVGTAQAPAQ